MKKVFVTLVIVGILYSVYSMGMAGHSYITIGNLLDDAVPRHIGTRGVADRQGATERNERIRAAVVQTITDNGFPIDKSDVTFSEEQGKLFVRVQRRHPVITWQGETKFAIPVAATSSFLLPPP
jgi:hypothetical protein